MLSNLLISPPSAVLPPRVPPPSHRHGAPSGPWPFLDLDTEARVNPTEILDPWSQPPLSARCPHTAAPGLACWCKYPQALFPNWTPAQQRASRIEKVLRRPRDHGTAKVYQLDVTKEGRFMQAETHEVGGGDWGGGQGQDEGEGEGYWRILERDRPEDTRVRALFVENITGPVLQILGTKFTIEPFFFSSAIGWIPARFQENVVPRHSDHISITLTFIRAIPNPSTVPPSPESVYSASTISRIAHAPPEQIIDTQAPLLLSSTDRILLPSLLALYMVRAPTSSTLLSYHPPLEHCSTPAAALYARVHATGRSVYWNNIVQRTRDPSVVLLSVLWYAVYAWEEALQGLEEHVCFLESRVLTKTTLPLTHELHVIRAHLLHYASLLADFRKTLAFVLATPYPALDNPTFFPGEERSTAEEVLQGECTRLVEEIRRLEALREALDQRVGNVMDLGFNSVNIEDSKRMAELTEASVRDSEAMKQISYLTMAFLPATFVATAFGMNVREIVPGTRATLWEYIACSVPLTMLTAWIVVVFQMGIDREEKNGVEQGRQWGLWARVMWPTAMLSTLLERRKERRKGMLGIIGPGAPP